MVHIHFNRPSDIPAALQMAGRILIRDGLRKLAQVKEEELSAVSDDADREMGIDPYIEDVGNK